MITTKPYPEELDDGMVDAEPLVPVIWQEFDTAIMALILTGAHAAIPCRVDWADQCKGVFNRCDIIRENLLDSFLLSSRHSEAY